MATVHFTLHAQRLLGAGKTNEAVALLEEGIREFPDYATAYALLARAYLQLHDVPTAYDVVASAIARFPAHRGLRLLHEQLEELISHTSSAQVPADTGAESFSSPSPTQEVPSTAEADSVADDVLQSTPMEPPLSPQEETLAEEQPKGLQQTSLEETVSASVPEAPLSNPVVEAVESSETTLQEHISTEAESTDTSPSSAAAPETATTSPPADDSGPSTDAPPAAALRETPTYTMRLVETATLDRRASRMVRSSNIRLIPGLEFAPLRIETNRQMETATVEYPAFRPIRGSQRQLHRGRTGGAAVPLSPADLEHELRSRAPAPEPPPHKTSLELLAERLEQVRIKSPDTSTPTPPPPPSAVESDEPSVVSETMAIIYEQQGALEEAIKAYTILARQHPERRAVFEEKIAQLRQRRS